MNPFPPRLEILPPSQRAFWPELAYVPRRFVLYGGTALGLRLGHRQSADFDFFSSSPLEPEALRREISWLAGAEITQSAPNTLGAIVQRDGPVRVAFFGGLRLGRVGQPQLTTDEVVWVASLPDLAGTKAAVVQERAEKKDYLDLAALLRAGITLEEAVGAAAALYGEQFNPLITLKALSYFADGDLPSLPAATRALLSENAARFTEPARLPRLADSIAP
jgi:hypothetical protein